MKNIFTLLLMVLILITASMAFAGPDLRWTSANNFHSQNQAPVQFFGPNGTLTQNTAVTHQWVDLSGAVLYSVYSASGTCFERLTAATGVNGTNIQTPIPNTTWQTRGVNPATPFLNLSGCVAGFVKIQ